VKGTPFCSRASSSSPVPFRPQNSPADCLALYRHSLEVFTRVLALSNFAGGNNIGKEQANGENAARSAHAPFKNGAALYGERVQNSY
jgi:hypothetical protein